MHTRGFAGDGMRLSGGSGSWISRVGWRGGGSPFGRMEWLEGVGGKHLRLTYPFLMIAFITCCRRASCFII